MRFSIQVFGNILNTLYLRRNPTSTDVLLSRNFSLILYFKPIRVSLSSLVTFSLRQTYWFELVFCLVFNIYLILPNMIHRIDAFFQYFDVYLRFPTSQIFNLINLQKFIWSKRQPWQLFSFAKEALQQQNIHFGGTLFTRSLSQAVKQLSTAVYTKLVHLASIRSDII